MTSSLPKAKSIEKMLLIFICNTSIGKVGNVGFRLQHVIQEASLEAKALIFARKSEELKNFNSNKYEFFQGS